MRRVLFPLLAILAVGGCAREPAAISSGHEAIRVTVAPVDISRRSIPVQATGIVARRAEAALAFKIGGVVRAVAVRPGDRVESGQVLAALDLAEIDAQLTQAQSAVEKARRDFARAGRLQETGVATPEQLQDARTGLEVAEATRLIAKFNRRFAVVTAPARGRILRRSVEPNELVAPGKTVLSFASDEEGWIASAGLADADVARIRLGNPARISAAGQSDLAGEVSQIAEATDPLTHTTEIEIRLAAVPAALCSGSVVEVEIQPDDTVPRAVVPAAALVEGEGRMAHVFLVSADNHTVQRQRVDVQALHDGRAYLGTPLPATARVVALGAEFLRDGSAIEITP